MGYSISHNLNIDNSYRQTKLDEKMQEKSEQIRKIEESNLNDELKRIALDGLNIQYDSCYKQVTIEDVLDTLHNIERFNSYYGSDCDPFDGEFMKWENREDHMKKVSKKLKDVLFIVSAVGEEPEDVWKEYYMNGKVQISEAKITFDPFDPSKLQ